MEWHYLWCVYLFYAQYIIYAQVFLFYTYNCVHTYLKKIGAIYYIQVYVPWGAGYAAKFKVDYTLNGAAQTYTSSSIAGNNI